jgi:ABC-type sulfate transport system substrate-binding protein
MELANASCGAMRQFYQESNAVFFARWKGAHAEAPLRVEMSHVGAAQ